MPRRSSNSNFARERRRARSRAGARTHQGRLKQARHDTPAQALFERIERDFSHSCVRVERPMDLAKYVLRDQPAWTEEKIDEAVHAGTERSVALKSPLPVYLVYFTVWEENGTAQFADDVYGFDRRQGARN